MTELTMNSSRSRSADVCASVVVPTNGVTLLKRSTEMMLVTTSYFLYVGIGLFVCSLTSTFACFLDIELLFPI